MRSRTRRGPESLAEVVEKGDVLVSTVGPFVRWGDAAAQAAIRKGAHYLDCNGEPPFTRRVFEHHGPNAAAAGVGLLTAFGWESVSAISPARSRCAKRATRRCGWTPATSTPA